MQMTSRVVLVVRTVFAKDGMVESVWEEVCE
jgi:hypothetical protein